MKKQEALISRNTVFLSILIVILLILCINFNEYYNYHLTFPNPGSDVPGIPGLNTFSISGEVIKINNDGFDLVDENNVKIHVISDNKISNGDYVEILGFLESSGTFREIEIIKTDAWGGELLILRSIIGLLLFLIIFFNYWKFNFNEFKFDRRE